MPERIRFVGLGILALLLFDCSSSQKQRVLSATTGKPELLESNGGATLLAMTEGEYHKLATQLVNMPSFIPMKRKPSNLGSGARFGINFMLRGLNRSWALDGDEKKGYMFYSDVNGNGDLGNDQPRRFKKENGKYSLLFKTKTEESTEKGKAFYPVIFKLVVSQVSVPGQSQPQACLIKHDRTLRRGTLKIENQTIAFSLIGSAGIYDQWYNSMVFDLDRDGELNLTYQSPELYLVREKYVKLASKDFVFVVDRYGHRLTLTPIEQELAPRPILLPGYPAPLFSFIDLEGKKHSLQDYRGRVVLLDFWATWCGPCIVAVPELVKIYQKYSNFGFSIIGINCGDPNEKLQKFISERNMCWPQTIEQVDGPIYSLYRVVGLPSYYLIGKDGRIISDHVNISDLPAFLEKLLSQIQE